MSCAAGEEVCPSGSRGRCGGTRCPTRVWVTSGSTRERTDWSSGGSPILLDDDEQRPTDVVTDRPTDDGVDGDVDRGAGRANRRSPSKKTWDSVWYDKWTTGWTVVGR